MRRFTMKFALASLIAVVLFLTACAPAASDAPEIIPTATVAVTPTVTPTSTPEFVQGPWSGTCKTESDTEFCQTYGIHEGAMDSFDAVRYSQIAFPNGESCYAVTPQTGGVFKLEAGRYIFLKYDEYGDLSEVRAYAKQQKTSYGSTDLSPYWGYRCEGDVSTVNLIGLWYISSSCGMPVELKVEIYEEIGGRKIDVFDCDLIEEIYNTGAGG